MHLGLKTPPQLKLTIDLKLWWGGLNYSMSSQDCTTEEVINMRARTCLA